jgi:uncharacterized cofD-like protein
MEKKKIVTIGGGTGSHDVLLGIKNIENISIKAIVSMADDGGSTGILRQKYGVHSPGDVRQCLAALSGRKFLSHKIVHGFLKGHKIGNILLAASEKLTGNFSRGLKIISWLLRAKGEIIPVTTDDPVLCAKIKNGTILIGEHEIDILEDPLEVTDIYYKSPVRLNPSARMAIQEADYVIICPGSFYTSLAPNFIVEGFQEAFAGSAAKIIAVENLGKKEVENYLSEVEKYLGKFVDDFISKDGFQNTERYNPLTIAEIIRKIIQT